MGSVNKRNSEQQGHAAANTGTNNLYNIGRGEEGQPKQFLVLAGSTFPVPVCTVSLEHWLNKAGTQ